MNAINVDIFQRGSFRNKTERTKLDPQTFYCQLKCDNLKKGEKLIMMDAYLEDQLLRTALAEDETCTVSAQEGVASRRRWHKPNSRRGRRKRTRMIDGCRC